MKSIKKTIRIPIYGSCKLHLLVIEDFEDFVQRKWPGEFPDYSESLNTHAASCLDWPDAWLVFRPTEITHSNLAHEICQLTLKIMRAVGMEECLSSEEAYCYLNGWLSEYVYFTLGRNNFKITHGQLDKKKKGA